MESAAPSEAELENGDLLLRILSMSADPYLRSGCKTGAFPRAMAGFVAGQVIASRKAGWEAGDFFGASLPFSTIQSFKFILLRVIICYQPA